VNLTPFAGGIEIGQDAAQQIGGGTDAYFIEQAKFISRDLGMKLEDSIFKRIVRTSIDTNRSYMLFDDVPEKPSETLAIVTWQSGEVCGLYSPAYGQVDGDRLFELEKLAGGHLYKNSKDVYVYGCYFKVVLGLLLANKRMYATVTNVDTTETDFAKTFPERMSDVMDEMLINGNTMIIMSSKLKTKIGNHYTTHATGNTLVKFDEKCNLSVCGVPVVTSQNVPLKVDWTKIKSIPGKTSQPVTP
jgi:hypothetical protein